MRLKKLCALVHVRAYVFLHVVKGNRWWMCCDSYLFSFSRTVRTPLPPACPGCLVFLHLSHADIDIPPQPLSNNLRWPVSTEARADLLCHKMCWRVSGSMSAHSWDGEKEDNQDKLGSFNSWGITKHFFPRLEFKTCKIISKRKKNLIIFRLSSLIMTVAECTHQLHRVTYSASCTSAMSGFLLVKYWSPEAKHAVIAT